MTALLDIKDLRSYYGQVQALHGIEFHLKEGSMTALLGTNGAGKTTTIRAICNMVRSTGTIQFEGKPLMGKSTESIVRLGIAHVPQGRGTFTTLTVEENLQLGAITRKDTKVIASDIEKMYSYFPKLKERHTQQAGTLSGGEQQMLAVARWALTTSCGATESATVTATATSWRAGGTEARRRFGLANTFAAPMQMISVASRSPSRTADTTASAVTKPPILIPAAASGSGSSGRVNSSVVPAPASRSTRNTTRKAMMISARYR